eukprot:3708011-Pleurochrysis_carterae.AAC.3
MAQLEERDLVKNLGEAVSNLVARADKGRFDRAVKLALAEVVLQALVVLTFFRCASVISLFNSCRVVHEQHEGATVEVGTDGFEEMAENVSEEGVPHGSKKPAAVSA